MGEEQDQRFEGLETRFRHLGYAVLFGVSALLFFPVFFGAIEGVRQDRIWDPFTEEPVVIGERVVDCQSETGELIFLAGQFQGLDGVWEQRYRLWMTRCGEEHPEFRELLEDTRGRLVGVKKRPEMGESSSLL